MILFQAVVWPEKVLMDLFLFMLKISKVLECKEFDLALSSM